MDTIRLTHCHTHFRKLGGVETTLKGHLLQDRQWGVESSVLAFFEPYGEIESRVAGLGLSWRDTVASARRKFRAERTRSGGGVAFYHNFWGVPFLAELDRAERRIALLHSDWPGLDRTLRAQRGLVDGALCVNTVLQEQIKRWMPSLPADRVAVAPLPIDSPKVAEAHRPLRHREIVCGFSGRVVREQKRVDRLPDLCARLEASGLNYRLEILGDGVDRRWLEQQLSGNRRVLFHGRQTGARYWEILSRWDVILFTSDYEGLPISMLEAFSCGVLPVYPRIRSGGDSYVMKVNPELLYNLEDLEQVVRILSRLQEAPDEEIASLRRGCQALAAPHQGDAYYRVFAEFVQQIHERPRITSETMPTRPFVWSDHCPFGLMRRMYYRGFYRRNDGW